MDVKLSADIDRLHAMITPEMRRMADPYIYGICAIDEAFRKATVADLLQTLEDFANLYWKKEIQQGIEADLQADKVDTA